MTGVMCTHYCSHGARCTLMPGHEPLHMAGNCRWPDAESITREVANQIMARTPEGREWLATQQPLADMIEALAEYWLDVGDP